MEERKMVPKRRFIGFEAEWKEKEINDVAEINPPSSLPEMFEYVDLESVVGTELVNHRTENKFTAPSRAQRLAQKGDIFYQTVRPYQKNNYLFSLLNSNYVFSTGYAQIRPIIDSKFLISKVVTKSFVNEVLNRCTGTSFPAINSNDLASIEIKIPIDKFEQQKIGQFFQLLDERIANQERKIAKVKALKSAYLTEMFPQEDETVPKRRFEGFDGEWDERKLGELSDIIGGGTPSTRNQEYWGGDIDWYSPVEIGEHIYVEHSQRKITELGLQKSSASILPVGTVLFTSRAGIGNTAILAKEGATNQGFQSIVPYKNELDSYFIFSRTHELKRYGEIRGAGSTFVEVSGKQMAEMSLLVPSLKEQQKIGQFFKNLDDQIATEEKKLEKLKAMKEAYLEEMFV